MNKIAVQAETQQRADGAATARRANSRFPDRSLRERRFGLLMALTGTIACCASFALLVERLSLYKHPGGRLLCDVNIFVSCSSVMERWQAELFGFPNPLLGLVGFTVVTTTGVLVRAKVQLPRWYWTGMQLGITLAMAWVIWFWSQALFSIGILCLYCLVVWAMVVPLFITITVRNLTYGVIPASGKLVVVAQDWSWTLVILLYIGGAGSVFFRFLHLFVGSAA